MSLLNDLYVVAILDTIQHPDHERGYLCQFHKYNKSSIILFNTMKKAVNVVLTILSSNQASVTFTEQDDQQTAIFSLFKNLIINL